MAVFNKFQSFVERLGKGEIDLNADTLKIYLSNTAPDTTADDVKADLAEISSGNGYTAGGEDMQNVYTETAGVGSLTGTDVVITATGGPIGPFRYVVLYDDTHASDALVGWWDRGSAATVTDGNTITVEFGTITLT